MTRQATDEEVNRWKVTPRPFEADPEDALTRLAQDFWAVTHPPQGMETTEKERRAIAELPGWLERLQASVFYPPILRAYIRDFDRLSADLAILRSERDVAVNNYNVLNSHVAKRMSEDSIGAGLEIRIEELEADLATAKRERDDWHEQFLDQVKDRCAAEERETDALQRAETAEADNLRLRNERDGALEALTDARAWVLECYEAWSPIMPFSGAYTGGELSRMTKIEAALKRPSPGTDK